MLSQRSLYLRNTVFYRFYRMRKNIIQVPPEQRSCGLTSVRTGDCLVVLDQVRYTFKNRPGGQMFMEIGRL